MSEAMFPFFPYKINEYLFLKSKNIFEIVFDNNTMMVASHHHMFLYPLSIPTTNSHFTIKAHSSNGSTKICNLNYI